MRNFTSRPREVEVGDVFKEAGWSVAASGWAGYDRVQMYDDYAKVTAWCWEWPDGTRDVLPPGHRKTFAVVKVPHTLVGDELKRFILVSLRLQC